MGQTDWTARLPDRIETKRLLLRRPAMADVMAITELANNIKIHRMLARLPHPYTSEDAIQFVTGMARTADDHSWAIEHDGGLIGMCGVHLRPDTPPELGYWLGEPHWGNGFASEMAISVVEAVGRTGAPSITAKALAVNDRSRRVLEKAGFAMTGEKIDACGVHKDVPVATFVREYVRVSS